MRQHEIIGEPRAPMDQAALIGPLPEASDQRAQQQLLNERHARMRRHFEAAHLH